MKRCLLAVPLLLTACASRPPAPPPPVAASEPAPLASNAPASAVIDDLSGRLRRVGAFGLDGEWTTEEGTYLSLQVVFDPTTPCVHSVAEYQEVGGDRYQVFSRQDPEGITVWRRPEGKGARARLELHALIHSMFVASGEVHRALGEPVDRDEAAYRELLRPSLSLRHARKAGPQPSVFVGLGLRTRGDPAGWFDALRGAEGVTYARTAEGVDFTLGDGERIVLDATTGALRRWEVVQEDGVRWALVCPPLTRLDAAALARVAASPTLAPPADLDEEVVPVELLSGLAMSMAVPLARAIGAGGADPGEASLRLAAGVAGAVRELALRSAARQRLARLRAAGASPEDLQRRADELVAWLREQEATIAPGLDGLVARLAETTRRPADPRRVAEESRRAGPTLEQLAREELAR